MPPEEREFLTVVCATNQQKVDEMKILVQEFRKKALEILDTDSPDGVYFLNFQLYPVTSKEQK